MSHFFLDSILMGLYFLCVIHRLLAPHIQLQLLKQPNYSHNCFRVSAVIWMFQAGWLRTELLRCGRPSVFWLLTFFCMFWHFCWFLPRKLKEAGAAKNRKKALKEWRRSTVLWNPGDFMGWWMTRFSHIHKVCFFRWRLRYIIHLYKSVEWVQIS